MSDAKPLVLTPGEDFPLVLTFRVKATGLVEDQTGAVYDVMVKDAPGKPDAEALTTLQVLASAPDAPAGKARLLFPRTQTRLYPGLSGVWVQVDRTLGGLRRCVFIRRIATTQPVIRGV